MSRGKLIRVGSIRKRIIYFAFLVIAVAFIGITMVYLRKKQEEVLDKKNAEKARLQRLIAEEEKRIEAIADYRAYIQTKSYIEEIAREVLGLVYKDEIIFKPVMELEPPRGEGFLPEENETD